MKKEILNFIEKRFPIDCNWMNGNCLWFAIILQARFPQSDIYYLPVPGHFVTKIEDKYYDWKGEIEIDVQEPLISLIDLKKKEPDWYQRLMRDCFY